MLINVMLIKKKHVYDCGVALVHTVEFPAHKYT